MVVALQFAVQRQRFAGQSLGLGKIALQEGGVGRRAQNAGFAGKRVRLRTGDFQGLSSKFLRFVVAVLGGGDILQQMEIRDHQRGVAGAELLPNGEGFSSGFFRVGCFAHARRNHA